MTLPTPGLDFLKQLAWHDLVLVGAILIVSRFLILLLRWVVRHTAEAAPPHRRLMILRWLPRGRLVIEVLAVLVILPILIEPTFQNTVALVATIGLALAFAFKDYGSCLIAGLVTIIENTYQPGDWIEIGGAYGEVKSIGLRAVHLVTTDDNEIIIPHSQLWSASISNATSGDHSVLCVARFYLHPDHDAATVCRGLIEIARTSPYLKPETDVRISVAEQPWGTLYQLKANAMESREQFAFVTDLTIRGKEMLRDMSVRFAQAPYAVGG
jgi:small conductance mechanosensitive channel